MRAETSGNLVFCGGKAQLIVTVKRFDAGKTAITSSEVFERHIDVVGPISPHYFEVTAKSFASQCLQKVPGGGQWLDCKSNCIENFVLVALLKW
ncbi:hypothetical protein DKX38_007860 [Salix brachista]|uniref:Uncharacterized protein n=1 Tax=Salix brachista TaxID=2182728 RepID=A0A5N5MRX3_9ROSI|nr:hypothetical protein DKX38_007860 [Salix brachista]